MPATCYEVGHEKNRIIVVDDFMDHPEALVRQAETMAPFPNETTTYYPGVRRRIHRPTPRWASVLIRLCRRRKGH